MTKDNAVKAGVMGATGYTGLELVRLLRNHGGVRVEMLTSTTMAGRRYGDVFESFSHTGYVLEGDDWSDMARRCDVVFLAMPHGVSAGKVTEDMLGNCAVIDLGADFRLKDASAYGKWYETEHPASSSNEARDILASAVYGLCEVYRNEIRETRLVANPGCYTTCSILALRPLLKEGLIGKDGIVIDAKSGASGAGRALVGQSMFCEVNEYMRPYKVAGHRHTPEIEQELSIAAGDELVLTFTPQLAPMERGILACSYARAENGVSTKDLINCLNDYYDKEPFVRVMPENSFPGTKGVCRSNFCDIGACVDERTGRAVVISALDNMVKGASGQAVQNMNIIFGFNETDGLLT